MLQDQFIEGFAVACDAAVKQGEIIIHRLAVRHRVRPGKAKKVESKGDFPAVKRDGTPSEDRTLQGGLGP
jgi:hypothetical protein